MTDSPMMNATMHRAQTVQKDLHSLYREVWKKDKILQKDWHKPEYAPTDDESKSKGKSHTLKV